MLRTACTTTIIDVYFRQQLSSLYRHQTYNVNENALKYPHFVVAVGHYIGLHMIVISQFSSTKIVVVVMQSKQTLIVAKKTN